MLRILGLAEGGNTDIKKMEWLFTVGRQGRPSFLLARH